MIKKIEYIFGKKSIKILFNQKEIMNQCWCYQCNKYVIPTSDFHCPICHEDYLEFEEDPNNEQELPLPQRPQPQQNFQQQVIFQHQGPQMQVFQFGFPPNILTNFNPFNIFNNIFQGHEQFQGQLGTIFQNVINRLPRGMGQPMNGFQMNDFFLGSEEQLQALAERLFRMNEQSLGSPPTDENFVNELKTTEYHQGECIEDVCSICLDQFNEGANIIVLPCKHGFHPDCLSPWLKIHSECPSCRHKLPPKQ